MTQPTLDRSLGLRSVVLFGLAYMAPMIVLGTFGAIAEETGGAVPSAYVLALIAMLFTAYSYGRLAATYPVAGSAYTYVRRTIDDRVGFLVGWATLLDYFFLPMVIWLIGATYLQQGFPDVPLWLWVVGFIVLTTILNVIGIRVADKANLILMTFQMLVVAAFVVLSLRHVLLAEGHRRVVQRGAVRQPGHHARRHRGRRGDRGVLVPRLRRGDHADRGDGEPAPDDAAGDPAHRPARRRDLRGGHLRHAAGAPRRSVRQPRLGRVRHRQDDRRRPVRLDLPCRVRGDAVRLRHRRAGQRVAAALRDGPGPGAAAEGVRLPAAAVPHACGRHRDLRPRRAHRPRARRRGRRLADQLRRVPGVHLGQRVRDRALPPAAELRQAGRGRSAGCSCPPSA